MNPHENTILRAELVETDDSEKLQVLKVLGRDGEMLGDRVKVLRVQAHGLTSHAPKGSLGAVIVMTGSPDMVLVLDMEHPDKRPRNLKEGEVEVYDAAGNYIYLKDDSTIEVKCKVLRVLASEKIVLETPMVYAGGEAGAKFVGVEGTLDTAGDALVSAFATRLKAV